MKPLHQVASDAIAIRGIIDYLEKSVEPVRIRELSMTQHLSDTTITRLCKLLAEAGVIEHPKVTRIVLGMPQEVPQLGWTLTKSFFLGGCEYDAEKLAEGL